MKYLTSLLILFLCSMSLFSQNLIINEIFYNPQGADSGYEWIELYNPTSENVNLEGWKIEKAGPSFATCFTFESSNIIHPHSFFLIGEEFVEEADIISSLAFQNGGSASDGVRLVSADEQYTDTILYDAPNSNALPDDISQVGEDFAPNVGESHSLARISDGVDTNSSSDWFDCSIPSPKSSNILPVNLAISDFYYESSFSNYTLFTSIQNLSTFDVDNFVASVKFFVDETLITQYDIPYFPLGDSIVYFVETGELLSGYHIFKVTLNCNTDSDLENNDSTISTLIGVSPVILNEVMMKPQDDDLEWIEIYNRTSVDKCVDNYFIKDRTDRKITLSGNIIAKDFLVVCKSKQLFCEYYPLADSQKVIESPTWTSLNNTTENLYFIDNYETIFDSLVYDASHFPENISYERKNPYENTYIDWNLCIDESGSTPTYSNSILPLDKNIKIDFVSILKHQDLLTHTLEIKNIGLYSIENASFKAYVKSGDSDFDMIFQDEILSEDSLVYSFNTDIPQIGYYSYKYTLYNEEDMNASDDSIYGFYNNGGLPFAVNEIMYNPENGEPEWIEIKKNYQLAELDSFRIDIGDNILSAKLPENDYFLITSSQDDADFLFSKYHLTSMPLTGLSALSNNGNSINLYDEDANLIENFEYDPKWNNQIKGTSIERINPKLTAIANNFGPSTKTSTPEQQNSLYIQIIPSQTNMIISPNPFSPYRLEHSIITYKLTDAINKISLRIFDLRGRLVKNISRQKITSSEGSLIWDGKDNNGKILPIGIYIINLSGSGLHNEVIYNKSKTVIIKK